MSAVLIVSAWRQATASAQARRPLTSFLAPSVPLPPLWGTRVGSQNPDLSENAISLTCCGHRHFLSTLVTWKLPHAHACKRICLETSWKCDFIPQRYFHPWKNRARFLALSGTAQQWQGSAATATMAIGTDPASCSDLRAEFIPGARPLCSPVSHALKPRCTSNNSLKYSNKYRSSLWLISFRLSLLVRQGRMKSSLPGAHRIPCPGWS